MVKPTSVLVAAVAAVLVLSNAAHAHSEDVVIQGRGDDVARRERFLRVGVASSSSHDAALLGDQDNADEESAVFSQSSSAGHAPPSADVGHDGKPPANHHGNDTPKDDDSKPKGDTKTDGPHHPPSRNGDHGHHHDASASSSSITGRHDAGDHTVVPPSQYHGNTKDGAKQPGKADGKPCGSDHQHHNPADVGYDGKSPRMDTKKDAAHDHDHGSGDAHAPGKDAAHKAAKSAKLSSVSAGSADAYLAKRLDAGSPHTTK